MYEVLDIIRCFDPSFVNEKKLDEDFVDMLARIKPIAHTMSLSALKSELSKYRTEAQGAVFNRTDSGVFTDAVLRLLRKHDDCIPAWSAAQVAIILTPNSSSYEEMLSLLDSMLGSDQLSVCP